MEKCYQCKIKKAVVTFDESDLDYVSFCWNCFYKIIEPALKKYGRIKVEYSGPFNK